MKTTGHNVNRFQDIILKISGLKSKILSKVVTGSRMLLVGVIILQERRKERLMEFLPLEDTTLVYILYVCTHI